MGKYNFEKDNGNFGETRRLDTINKEVQKIEKRARKHIEKETAILKILKILIMTMMEKFLA